MASSVIADPAGAQGFVDRLVSDAPSPIDYASATKPEVLAEDGEIAKESLRIDRARCRVVPAEAMFER